MGYIGPLCQECDNKNGFFGNNGVCSKCEEKWKIVFKLLFTFISSVVLLYMTIKGI
jgi:hypothetical protein